MVRHSHLAIETLAVVVVLAVPHLLISLSHLTEDLEA